MEKKIAKMDQMKVTFTLVRSLHSDVLLDNGCVRVFQKDVSALKMYAIINQIVQMVPMKEKVVI